MDENEILTIARRIELCQRIKVLNRELQKGWNNNNRHDHFKMKKEHDDLQFEYNQIKVKR